VRKRAIVRVRDIYRKIEWSERERSREKELERERERERDER
jgi:hypothetical protein